MGLTRNKDLNKLLKIAGNQGFICRGGYGKHVKVYNRNRTKFVTVSHSPSSSSTKMVKCDLEKLGVKF
jgi:hypothetical protein